MSYQAYMAMFPQTIKRREDEEYSEYSKSMKQKGLAPEPTLYKAYVKSEQEAGRTPKPAVNWANDRAKVALETESDEVRARVAKAVEDFNDKKVLKINPAFDDNTDLSKENKEDSKYGEKLCKAGRERREKFKL